MPPPFAGVWPAMITPTTPDGQPAFHTLERLTELFIRQKLGGIYLTGSTGQWPLFNLDERQAIAECVVRAAGGKIPVMVHVGATTTADAEMLAQHAESIGADAISAVGPIYYSHPLEAVFEHYRRVGSASSLPFFVYHLSGVSQSIQPREYVDRLLNIPNVAGMKITDKDLYPFGLIHAYAGERLCLLSGADEVMCHAILSGASGAIGTFYNVWGPACDRARQACLAGKIDTARRFMLTFQTAIARVLAAGSLWSFMRSAMQRRYDIDVGMPRPPLAATEKPWDDAEVDRLLAEVDGAIA